MLAAPVNECAQPGELPEDYVRRLAKSKAYGIVSLLEQTILSDCIIIAADTAVIDTNGIASGEIAKDKPGQHEILGKPSNAAEAERMLRQLRGRVHKVLTGLVVLRPNDDFSMTEINVTEVPMRSYSDEEIKKYISSGDPLDKAGAYAIQHVGFRPVEKVSGCYANVMGLPLCQLTRMLSHFDIFPGMDIARSCQEALSITCPVVNYTFDERDQRIDG